LQTNLNKTKEDKNTLAHELSNLNNYNRKLEDENSKFLNEATKTMNKTMNRSSLWLPDTFNRYKDIEMRSTSNLVDRLITAQPNSTLKGIMTEYSDLSILKTETEVRQIRLEAEIAEIDREIH